MPAASRTPLTRGRAWTCVVINQFATPGLGSIMGGRRLAGTFQLMLALAGCIMILTWLFQFFFHLSEQQMGQPVSGTAPAWMGKWGLILFGASWVWAWITSVSLLRAAKAEAPKPGEIPPRIIN